MTRKVGMVDWLNLVTGFLGGVLVTLFGACVTAWFHRRAERIRNRDDVRFRVYMKLIELKGPLFWMLSAELKGLPPKPKFEYEAEMMAWKIADELRQADDLENLDAILWVLFFKGFDSVKARYEALEGVLNQLAKTCNPRYRDSIRKINEENMRCYKREFEDEMARGRHRPDNADRT
jgi:hypothetical protein